MKTKQKILLGIIPILILMEFLSINEIFSLINTASEIIIRKI